MVYACRSTCCRYMYMHMCEDHRSPPLATPALFPNLVSHWTCCPLCPHLSAGLQWWIPRNPSVSTLVRLPKPFLLRGIEVWEATLRFFMEPRVPNLCSKHLTYCAVFPAQEYLLITKNKLTWWGTSVIQTLGKQRREDTYKFKASLIYLTGSYTTGPISKK